MDGKKTAVGIGIAAVAICVIGWIINKTNESNNLHVNLNCQTKPTDSTVETENPVAKEQVIDEIKQERIQKTRQLLLLFKEFQSIKDLDTVEAEKKGVQLLNLAESIYGKSESLYGIICSELSDVYYKLNNPERQKELLLMAEETLREIENMEPSYIQVTKRLFVLCATLFDYEGAAKWSGITAEAMENIYLNSQSAEDLKLYATAYYNHSFYCFYSGQLLVAKKWYYFSRDILTKYFLFASETIEVIKSKTTQLFMNCDGNEAFKELMMFNKMILDRLSIEPENEKEYSDKKFFVGSVSCTSTLAKDHLEIYSKLISHTAHLLFLEELYEDCEICLMQLYEFNVSHGLINYQTKLDLISVYWHQGKEEKAILLEDEIINKKIPELGKTTSKYLRTTTCVLYQDTYILELSVNKKKSKLEVGKFYEPTLYSVSQFFLVVQFQNPHEENYIELTKLINAKEAPGIIKIDYKLEKKIESNGYFKAILNIYSDANLTKLLGTHRQLIYGATK